MSEESYTSRVHTASHWGAYDVLLRDGKLIGTQPFARDPNPSPMIDAMAEAVYASNRISAPMVRQGFLAYGSQSDRSQRGHEPFVAVSWDQALDLIATELRRVQNAYGNEAIYASSGWASAGIFHNAASQLYRFLNAFGGYVSQVTNYSYGAASVIVPHIVGSMQPVLGPHTAWASICDHTDLMVMFVGMAPKNVQVNLGGVGCHEAENWLQRVYQSGTKFVNISPMQSRASAFEK